MLTDDGAWIRVEAPCGQIIKATGLHGIQLLLRGWKREEAYRSILRDLDRGLERCVDADCECCVHEQLTYEELLQLYPAQRLA
jgi:hypothetical protein